MIADNHVPSKKQRPRSAIKNGRTAPKGCSIAVQLDVLRPSDTGSDWILCTFLRIPEVFGHPFRLISDRRSQGVSATLGE
jgi:hypothetical protein